MYKWPNDVPRRSVRLGVGDSLTWCYTNTRVGNKGIFNIAKPAGILLVPLHGCPQPLLPAHLLLPSQLCQLATVDRVPQIIKLPIGDKCNEIFLLIPKSENINQLLSHLQVANLVVSANIENLSRLGLVKNDLKGTCNILHIEEVASVASISMQRHRTASQELIGELWDQLLRELMRTVDIISASDNAWKFERTMVRFHQKLRPSLGGSVRVGGFQHMLLLHRFCFERFSLSVHFICGHVNESPNTPVALGGLKEHVGSKNITLGEVEGVSKGVVHVSLRREVHHSIDLFLRHDVGYKVRAANISLYEFEVFEPGDFLKVGEARAVVKFVIDYHFVLRVFFRE
mmetsp:Transcript_12249/g.26071  ORF Transcript_12249/g.26071 Transcript_12249/m.26071 type:complete len:343 (-) Transcript_12249:292-1320(-)